MNVTITGLRVLRETADRGTFTAAAAALGYTQSAVSRQVAALERAAGATLFERRPDGPRLTAEGRVLLRRARTALDEIDRAGHELHDRRPGGRVRLGVFPSAGAALLPGTLRRLRRTRPDLQLTTRVSASSAALVRSLRAGSLDLAVLASRPPHRPVDAESPPLAVRVLVESRLHVAVPAESPLAGQDGVTLADLADQSWIVTSSARDESPMGAWPSLPGRPRVEHVAADWAAKLGLVAAGCGVTTISRLSGPAAPVGVRLLPVVDGPVETRRIVAARVPDRPSEPSDAVLDAITDALVAVATELDGD